MMDNLFAQNEHIIAFLQRSVDPEAHPKRLVFAFGLWTILCVWISHAHPLLCQLFFLATIASIAFYFLVTYQRRQFKNNRALTDREKVALKRLKEKCYKWYSTFQSIASSLEEERSNHTYLFIGKVFAAAIVLSFLLSFFSFMVVLYFFGVAFLVFISNARAKHASEAMSWVTEHAVKTAQNFREKQAIKAHGKSKKNE
eukprot:m.137188 g.137188  ORF g.137188 m.137188 type:complete len:199 (+) comp11387_c0_seq1:134-730(+)